tara:strand:- start:713 stop:1294 length:582 start_codon:yes stop_codon:yes gene_type:complete
MGCDIHMYVERWLRDRWVPVAPRTPEGAIEGDYRRTDFALFYDQRSKPSPIEQMADASLPFEDQYPRHVMADWFFGREYAVFAELAGVRGSLCSALVAPRGMPKDLSVEVSRGCWLKTRHFDSSATREIHGQTYYWAPDWHTPHWYSLSELVFFREDRLLKRRTRELIEEMERVAKTYNLPYDKVRTVFWFDG